MREELERLLAGMPPEEAELQILVMTAPDDPAEAAGYVEELAGAVEENLSRGIPTVLDEASNNAYGDALETALLDRVRFGELAAFAGKYDQANVTGAALAMGFSRYLYLQCCQEKSADCDAAQVRQLAASMALTEYILHTRAPLNAYVEELGLNRNNMSAADEEEAQLILEKLRELFTPEAEKVCGNLSGGGVLSEVSPFRIRDVGAVVITEASFPWQRTFEIALQVEAEV